MGTEYAYREIIKDLKENNIGSVVLLYGKEQFQVDWAQSLLIDKYINPAVRELDVTTFQDNPSANEIINACETLTMFSERRVVIIPDCGFFNEKKSDGGKTGEAGRQDNKDKQDKQDKQDRTEKQSKHDSDSEILVDYIPSLPETTLLIFRAEKASKRLKLYKAIEKKGKAYDFQQLQLADLKGFIVKRFNKADKHASDRVVQGIIDLSGYYNRETVYTLFNLENDLAKIIAHSDGPEISSLDVMQTLSGDIDTYVFSLVEALGTGDKGEALALFNNMAASGENVFKILGLLASQYELILDIRELLDKGADPRQISAALGVNEFRVRKAAYTAGRYSAAALRKVLLRLYAVDKHIKTGLLEPTLAMEYFIGEL